MPYCTNCGVAHVHDAAFCKSCGAAATTADASNLVKQVHNVAAGGVGLGVGLLFIAGWNGLIIMLYNAGGMGMLFFLAWVVCFIIALPIFVKEIVRFSVWLRGVSIMFWRRIHPT